MTAAQDAMLEWLTPEEREEELRQRALKVEEERRVKEEVLLAAAEREKAEQKKKETELRALEKLAKVELEKETEDLAIMWQVASKDGEAHGFGASELPHYVRLGWLLRPS